jgi:hypothetical protein
MKRRSKGKMKPVNQQRTVHAYSLFGDARQSGCSSNTQSYGLQRTHANACPQKSKLKSLAAL